MLLGGRYELNEPLGTGGFSEVWRATDTVLSRPVAIKLLRAHYLQQAEALARFQAEARYAGALCHENIARVYDYSEPADGQPYLVMELVDGPSLASLLKTGPLDAARTMDMVAQAAAGLQAAHDAGMIHRDIKPANLLLTPGGTVKITDFGIAHAAGAPPVTVTGMLIGTPGYMAPERVAGAQATPASDLYALGVVAYECLAGAPPFSGVPLEVALAHRERPLPPLPMSVPADVAAFVMQLTAKDAVWRPGSAADVARCAAALRDAVSRAPAGSGAGPGLSMVPAPSAPATSAEDFRLGAAPPARRVRSAGPSPRQGRLGSLAGRRRPSARAVSSVVLAGLAGLALAGVLRLAAPLHEASAPSVRPPGSALGLAPAPRPAARHHTSESADTSARATGHPVAVHAAAMAPPTSEAAAASPEVREQGPGHQHHGDQKAGAGAAGKNGRGHGKNHDGSGKGNGPDGPGEANAQVLSSRR